MNEKSDKPDRRAAYEARQHQKGARTVGVRLGPDDLERLRVLALVHGTASVAMIAALRRAFEALDPQMKALGRIPYAGAVQRKN